MNADKIINSLQREWERKSKKLGVSLSYDDQTNLAILRAAIEHFGAGTAKAKLRPCAVGYYWKKPQNQRAQAYWTELWPNETPPGMNGSTPKAQPKTKTTSTYPPRIQTDLDLMSKLQEQFR